MTRTELPPGPTQETDPVTYADALELAPLIEEIAGWVRGHTQLTTVSFEIRYGARTRPDREDRRDTGWSRAIFIKTQANGQVRIRWIRDIAEFQRLVPAAQTMLAPPPAIRTPARTLRQLPVILPPDIAGVLIHELIGHALEEAQVPQDHPVLPVGSTLMAVGTVQPDGTKLPCIALIDDGRLIPADRSAGPHAMGWRVTHRRRGLHGIYPQLRLPCLSVSMRLADVVDANTLSTENASLVCQAMTGGRYFDGYGVIDISAAEYAHNQASGPLRLVVTHDDLAASRFIRQQTPAALTASLALGGVCIKNGEEVPSFVDTPALMLPASVIKS